MKSIKIFIMSSLVVFGVSSCSQDEKITANRGKVKFETISVSSKLGGRIAKLYVEEGQAVKKGDTLAYIDIPEVSAKLMQAEDRKSTRLNSSHVRISYAVFCLKKKKKK